MSVGGLFAELFPDMAAPMVAADPCESGECGEGRPAAGLWTGLQSWRTPAKVAKAPGVKVALVGSSRRASPDSPVFAIAAGGGTTGADASHSPNSPDSPRGARTLTGNMTDPAPGWNDEEIRRFAAICDRLQAWGWTPINAEAKAERLVDARREGDDRRHCVECFHYRPGRCRNHSPAGIGGAAVPEDLAILPQRCPGFAER